MTLFSWHSVPFARILLPAILGIILWNYFPNHLFFATTVLLVSFLCFFSIHFIPSSENKFRLRMLAGILLSLILLTTFYFRSRIIEPEFDQLHFSHLKSSGYFSVCIQEVISEKPNHFKTFAQVDQVKGKDGRINASTGLLLLKISKEALTIKPKIGDRFFINAKFLTVEGPKNPGDFDFRNYLRRKHITHTAFVQKGKILKLVSHPISIRRTAEELRDYSLNVMRRYIPNPISVSVSEALLMGYKDDLDPETNLVFTRSGTLHVLAVSGLHAGLIYMMLNFLSGFLLKFRKGKYLQLVILLGGLWLYIFMTGLSSSVIRAGFMFSLLSVSKLFNLKNNVFNTIFASAFLMLLMDTNYLFDPGFQLSYAAVLGIVLVYPRLRNYYPTSSKFIRPILDLCNVTLSAQVFTFPLSLYYFNQFPSYFLLTNVVVIPIFTLLLILLIILIPLSIVVSFASTLGFLIHYLIQFSLWFMKWTDNLPHAVLGSIDLNLQNAVLLYGLVFSVLAYLMHKKKWMFFTALSICLVLSGFETVRSIKLNRQKFISIHNIRGHDVYTCAQGRRGYIISDSEFLIRKSVQIHLSKFFTQNGLKEIHLIDIQKSFVSTNISVIPEKGFQFFDIIMTMTEYHHIKQQKEVYYIGLDEKKILKEIFKIDPNKLVISNKLKYNSIKNIQNIYFTQKAKYINLIQGFRLIPVH